MLKSSAFHGALFRQLSILLAVSIRFDYQIVGSLDAYHLHIALTFRRKWTHLEVSEHNMLRCTQSVE